MDFLDELTNYALQLKKPYELGKHLISYTGDITSNPPESVLDQINLIDTPIQKFDSRKISQIVKQLKILKKRIKKEKFDEFLKVLEKIGEYHLIDENGDPELFVGVLNEKGEKIKLVFNSQLEIKLFNKAVDWRLERYDFGNLYMVLPTTFAYDIDYFDLNNEQKLLLPQSYKKDKYKLNCLRSSNLKLTSHDKLHKVGVSYALGIDEMNEFYIDLKYMAFGLKTKSERDKIDIVARINSKGNLEKILHYEAFLPKTQELDTDRIAQIASENLIESNGEIDINILSQLHNLRNRNSNRHFGFQIRTDRKTGETFCDAFHEDTTQRVRNEVYDFENWSNYKQTLLKPQVLGGRVFKYFVNQTRKNMKELKNIHSSFKFDVKR